MARSTYVYVVVDTDGNIVSAFTVKHEMQSWLNRHKGDHRVWRVRDNDTTHKYPPVEITDELE